MRKLFVFLTFYGTLLNEPLIILPVQHDVFITEIKKLDAQRCSKWLHGFDWLTGNRVSCLRDRTEGKLGLNWPWNIKYKLLKGGEPVIYRAGVCSVAVEFKFNWATAASPQRLVTEAKSRYVIAQRMQLDTYRRCDSTTLIDFLIQEAPSEWLTSFYWHLVKKGRAVNIVQVCARLRFPSEGSSGVCRLHAAPRRFPLLMHTFINIGY